MPIADPMRLDPVLEQLTPLLGALSVEPDEQERLRILLSLVEEARAAEGTSLWRQDESGTWREVVSRGSREGMLSAAELDSIAQGRVSREFYPGVIVLLAGPGAREFALVLISPSEEEARIDIVEASLALMMVASETTDQSSMSSTLETLLAPFQDSVAAYDPDTDFTGSLRKLMGSTEDELDDQEAPPEGPQPT